MSLKIPATVWAGFTEFASILLLGKPWENLWRPSVRVQRWACWKGWVPHALHLNITWNPGGWSEALPILVLPHFTLGWGPGGVGIVGVQDSCDKGFSPRHHVWLDQDQGLGFFPVCCHCTFVLLKWISWWNFCTSCRKSEIDLNITFLSVNQWGLVCFYCKVCFLVT